MHTTPAPSGRREWTAPQVLDLPPLVDLTLQTGGIPGGFSAGVASFGSKANKVRKQ